MSSISNPCLGIDIQTIFGAECEELVRLNYGPYNPDSFGGLSALEFFSENFPFIECRRHVLDASDDLNGVIFGFIRKPRECDIAHNLLPNVQAQR